MSINYHLSFTLSLRPTRQVLFGEVSRQRRNEAGNQIMSKIRPPALLSRLAMRESHRLPAADDRAAVNTPSSSSRLLRPAAASVSLLAHALQGRRRVVHCSITSGSVLLPLPVAPTPGAPSAEAAVTPTAAVLAPGC